jgi:hypothetical protein
MQSGDLLIQNHWLTGACIISCVVMGLFQVWLFFLDRNAERKKRMITPFAIGIAGVFLLGGYTLTRDKQFFLFGIFPAAYIIFMFRRTVAVCGACGGTSVNMSPTPWVRPEFCSKCGASLTS